NWNLHEGYSQRDIEDSQWIVFHSLPTQHGLPTEPQQQPSDFRSQTPLQQQQQQQQLLQHPPFQQAQLQQQLQQPQLQQLPFPPPKDAICHISNMTVIQNNPAPTDSARAQQAPRALPDGWEDIGSHAVKVSSMSLASTDAGYKKFDFEATL
ncbi:hypothetical protein HDU98_004364, partial [Podochytrium sp. JEL0797]